jgi:putative protease
LKILAPLSPVLEPILEKMISLGVDEFYFGYTNQDESSSEFLSRRPGKRGNFESLKKTRQIAEKIRKSGRKSFITINEHSYPEQFISKIVSDVSFLSNYVDGFIVTDLGLIYAINNNLKTKIYFIASTGAHLMNSNSINFYKKFGIKRVILPRHLDIKDITEIIKKDFFEFEIFVLNDKCPNIDGLCSYCHGNKIDDYDFGQACKRIIKSSNGNFKEFNSDACGICSMFLFRDCDNISVKIVGRDKNPDKIIKDVELVSTIRNNIHKFDTFKDFMNFSKKKYFEILGKPCNENCYYSFDKSRGED